MTDPAEPPIDGSAQPLEDPTSSMSAPIGRRKFIVGAAAAAGAASLVSSAQASGHSAPAGASYYSPIQPQRLADSRLYGEYASKHKRNLERRSDRSIRVKVVGARDENNVEIVPTTSKAVAAVISIAAVNDKRVKGWVRATPAGDTSEVANVILQPEDAVVLNLVTVKLSSDGYVDITGLLPGDVVIDLAGLYLPTDPNVAGGRRRGGRMVSLPAVKRVKAGTFVQGRTKVTVQIPTSLGVPPTAQAVVVNITAVNAQGRGYMTAFPTGSTRPLDVSSLNFNTGEVRGAGAIVKLGESGGVNAFDVYAHTGALLYVDLSGYITGDGDATETADGLFVPISPHRILDTRRSADIIKANGKVRLWAGWTRPFTLPVSQHGFGPFTQMGAIAMNVTSVTTMKRGYLTVLPAQTPRQEVSNLNIFRAGQTIANHVVTAVSNQGVECYSHTGANVVCDVAGWYVGTPQAATVGVPIDPDPPPAPFDWTVSVPDMGLNNLVQQNLSSGDPVVNRGQSWHWTNTGLVGQAGSAIVVFGHRTDAGGPYRRQHDLNGNSRLTIITPDQRRYVYKYVWEQIRSTPRNGSSQTNATRILDAARAKNGSTFTLVACTLPNTLPTSLDYRLITTFELESRSGGRQFDDISPTLP